jgi:uncharacterized protein (DUF4415 family)
MKDESTANYSTDDLREMRRRGSDRTNWRKVDSTTDEELERVISKDEDERDLEPDWARAHLVLPESKAHINLRVDRDVLRFFKERGPGYQTRMNAVLRAYMNAHQKRQT